MTDDPTPDYHVEYRERFVKLNAGGAQMLTARAAIDLLREVNEQVARALIARHSYAHVASQDAAQVAALARHALDASRRVMAIEGILDDNGCNRKFVVDVALGEWDSHEPQGIYEIVNGAASITSKCYGILSDQWRRKAASEAGIA
jgi:hypothetical protein